MVKWTNKTFYINETTQISMGKLILVVVITLFQFLGMWCENGWIMSGSMFFLFANAFFTLSKSTKKEDKLAEDSKKLIVELRNEVIELKEKVIGLKEDIIEIKSR